MDWELNFVHKCADLFLRCDISECWSRLAEHAHLQAHIFINIMMFIYCPHTLVRYSRAYRFHLYHFFIVGTVFL